MIDREGWAESASGEGGHGDECLGTVVAIGAAGQQPDVGVGGFGQGVTQAVVEGIVNQGQESFDRARQLHELGNPAALRPGQPTGQQRSPGGSFSLENGAELFLEQVRSIQRVVHLRNDRQRRFLITGQID
jgi:hypothetical protein